MRSPVSTSSLHKSVGITGFYIQLYVGVEIQVPILALTVLCLRMSLDPQPLRSHCFSMKGNLNH